MKCPNCNRDILDSAIICPFCNTQFAFSAPSTFNNMNSKLYESVPKTNDFNPVPYVEQSENKGDNVEFNPSENIQYIEESKENNNLDELNFAGTNPVSINPIQPESPNNSKTIKVEHFEPKQEVINNPVEQNKSESIIPPNPNNLVSQPVLSDLPPTIQNNNKQLNIVPITKDKMFFMSVIVIGVIVLLILAFMLILGGNKKNIIDAQEQDRTSSTTVSSNIVRSNNIGVVSSYVAPTFIGNTTIASLFSTTNNKYYDVDVTGIRFITGVEATQLGEAFNKKPLDSFVYEGFVYKVKLNDLQELGNQGVNPVLESKVYRLLGSDFFNVNGESYTIKVQSIYDGGNITNGGESQVTVIYSVPDFADNYSICFGNREHSLGCFTK